MREGLRLELITKMEGMIRNVIQYNTGVDQIQYQWASLDMDNITQAEIDGSHFKGITPSEIKEIFEGLKTLRDNNRALPTLDGILLKFFAFVKV